MLASMLAVKTKTIHTQKRSVETVKEEQHFFPYTVLRFGPFLSKDFLRRARRLKSFLIKRTFLLLSLKHHSLVFVTQPTTSIYYTTSLYDEAISTSAHYQIFHYTHTMTKRKILCLRTLYRYCHLYHLFSSCLRWLFSLLTFSFSFCRNFKRGILKLLPLDDLSYISYFKDKLKQTNNNHHIHWEKTNKPAS